MNAKAWPLVVRQYSTLVWRTAYRLLANSADAEICFGETFVGAWEAACEGPVRDWARLLQRLATANALEQLQRRDIAQQTIDYLEPGDEDWGEGGRVGKATTTELTEQLRWALAHLPKRQGQAYCLRNFCGFSCGQIADELGMDADDVGEILYRARSHLRAAMRLMEV